MKDSEVVRDIRQMFQVALQISSTTILRQEIPDKIKAAKTSFNDLISRAESAIAEGNWVTFENPVKTKQLAQEELAKLDELSRQVEDELKRLEER